METSIVEERLTDGSVVHNVVFLDGSARVVIAALSERDARRIEEVLATSAAYAVVDDARYSDERAKYPVDPGSQSRRLLDDVRAGRLTASEATAKLAPGWGIIWGRNGEPRLVSIK